MADMQRVGSLEIAQDLDFQRKEWRAQRVGWAIIALLLLAAFLGMTGSGPLAAATAGDAGSPLQVEYARFGRVEAPARLEVKIGGDAVTATQVELWMERAYLQTVALERVVPEPAEVRGAGDRLTYVFGVESPGQDITVSFDLRHITFGSKSTRIWLGDDVSLSFNQFVLP